MGMSVVDALIAATARVHGMTVATRNVKDFEQADVHVLNPFEPVGPGHRTGL